MSLLFSFHVFSMNMSIPVPLQCCLPIDTFDYHIHSYGDFYLGIAVCVLFMILTDSFENDDRPNLLFPHPSS